MPNNSVLTVASSKKSPASPFQIASDAEIFRPTSSIKQSRNDSSMMKTARTTIGGISPLKLELIKDERKKAILKLNKLASLAHKYQQVISSIDKSAV